MGKGNETICPYADADRPVFWMDDKEIRRSYLQADDKVYQVQVIAELNARSMRDTVRKLLSLGLDVDVRKIRSVYGGQPRKRWTQKDIAEMFRLHRNGLSWKEIGYELNRSGASVQNKYLRCTGRLP